MGARGCLGSLLLLLLPPPFPWAGGSGVGSESLPGAVAAAGGDRPWLQPSIIGGHEAKRHSRPYMASLQFGGVHSCGAALLHRRWALTAAHCLSRRSWHKGRLLVGLHNWRDDDEEDTQSFAIRAACPHPGYDQQTMENDLLLLQGDSGGPLVCGKRPAVAGVVSFGSGNAADPFKPPVAASTVKHKKWIQKILRRGCGSGQPEHTG